MKLYIYKLVRFFRFRNFYWRYILSNKNITVFGPITIINPTNLNLGKNVSFNDYCYINCTDKVIIGNNVSISSGAKILTTSLEPTSDSLKRKVHINKPVTINDNVQIGANSVLLPGITIGSNVIIAAGAVVTKNISSNTIYFNKISHYEKKI